ncbi:MAG: TCR/Tet family MFS transporter [Candidatus Rokuibacteriota bacterium]
MSAAAPRRAALAFIFVTVVLDMLAVGMIVPVLPKLILGFLGGDTAYAAQIYGLAFTLWAVMQFFFSPVLGVLSDRFGRRPIVLLSNFGLGLDYVLMALAPNLAWLFVGRVISGITTASISTAGAYIADVTPPEKRAAAFGMISVAFGLGFVLGPAVGGMLGAVEPRLPFWVSAVLSLANATYGLFVLPESLPPERRSRFAWRRANPVGSLTMLRSHAALLGLASVMFLSNLAHEALPSTSVLYVTYRYGWDERTVGFTLAIVGVCWALVGGVLVRPAVKRFGERRALLAGLFFGAAGFAILGLAPTSLVYWLGIPVFALWGFANPALQGLMTVRVGPSEQGQLQGALGSLRGIAFLLGPGIFSQTFAWFVAHHDWHLPGAALLLAALFLAAALVLSWRLTQRTMPA